MRYNKSKAGLWWWFDRYFGDNRYIWVQILFILVLIVLLVAFIGLVGSVLSQFNLNDDGSSIFIQSVGLAFGASNLPPGEGQSFPVLWQAVAFLLGAVLFSGVTITFVGNLLGNRQEAYRNGTARYPFSGHVLILGGGEMIDAILKDVCHDPNFCHRHIVIVTQDDVQEERLRLKGWMNDVERCCKVTVLLGRRDNISVLKEVNLEKCVRVYIVGEHPDDDDYDSVNTAAWYAAKKLCEDCGIEGSIPCFLFYEHYSSSRLFHLSDMSRYKSLDTLALNRLESMAQNILVKNSPSDNRYPTLDRDGIGPDSPRTVHLVIYGMSSFATAIAVTAAHICHFPNFLTVEAVGDRKDYREKPDCRTKITFIAPDIKEPMERFTAQYKSLFAMSKVTYNDTVTAPDEDFLDVEWEFVEGNIAEESVRSRLERYYRENMEGHTYLTLAICNDDFYRNIDIVTQYLPDNYHKVVMKEDGSVDFEKTIPVFVYLPDGEGLIQMVRREAISIYRNLFAMGNMAESYSPASLRRMEQGKKVNYLYSVGQNYQGMKPTEIEYCWSQISERGTFLRLSNIYCANHIGVKMRSLGLHLLEVRYGDRVGDDEVELMAVVEHNRWNVERLLMGYSPVAQEAREELKQYERQGDVEKMKTKKGELKKLRADYCHNCIAPYGQLIEDDKVYDKYIIRFMPDVVTNNQN